MKRLKVGLAWSVLLLGGMLTGFPSVVAQEATSEWLSVEYVPPSALAVVYVDPQRLLAAPETKLLPTEVVDAWMGEMFQARLADIESIVAVIGPPGPAGPSLGILIKTTRPLSMSDFDESMFSGEVERMSGYAVRPLADTPDLFMTEAAPQAMIVGTESMLTSMMSSPEGSGVLATFASRVPQVSPVMAVASMAPIRGQVRQMAQQLSGQVPPPLEALAALPELVDGVVIGLGVSSKDPLRVVMLGRDEEAAADAQEILTEAIDFGRQMFLAQSLDAMRDEDGPIADAMRSYYERLSGELTAMITPRLDGKRVAIEVELQNGMASTGVMVGLLLPAVQAAREAARRTSSMNNLKQIMLAIHNHEAAYRRMPAAVSRDDDDKPLLSWRVQLLPFLEEQQLYNEFRLDEPWDSEHNLALLERMPEVYASPGASLPPGMTIYQVPVGEGLAFDPEKALRFAEFTDGLSNTVGVFEADADKAVPWTKPEDTEIDMEDPLAVMSKARNGGFNVALMDGSVRFISNLIDANVFRALLTRNGGEVVPLQ